MNGNQTSVILEVRATRQASFEVALTLRQLVLAGGFLTPDFLTSASTMLHLLGGTAGSVGLMGLIKRLRGNEPRVILRTPATITLEIDGERYTAPTRILDLYQDGAMRNHLEGVVRPLGRDGFESLTIKEDNQSVEVIEKSDVAAFQSLLPPGSLAPVETVIPSQRLMPVSVSFKPGNKWRLTDGDKAHLYTVSDPEFNRQVLEGRKIGSQDVLICELRQTQYIDREGRLRTDRSRNYQGIRSGRTGISDRSSATANLTASGARPHFSA